jgi:hypothetical protein
MPGAQGTQGIQGIQGQPGPKGDPGAGPINLADVYMRFTTINVGLNQDGARDTFCDAGDPVIGGSCEASGGDGHTTFTVDRPVIPADPTQPGSRGWLCNAHNYSTVQGMTLRANAICYNVP